MMWSLEMYKLGLDLSILPQISLCVCVCVCVCVMGRSREEKECIKLSHFESSEAYLISWPPFSPLPLALASVNSASPGK